MATEYASGIDVSRWQDTVDWQEVRDDGIVFVFVKATDGLTWVDPRFEDNWAGMKAAGLLRGSYHFFQPNQNPLRQAEHYVQTMEGVDSMELLPVLDLEVDKAADNATIAKGAETWLQTVERLLGRIPIIYTRASFWNHFLIVRGKYPDWTDRYGLWVAHYTSLPDPTIPRGWNTWDIWQFTEMGRVRGVRTNVDLNRYNGTLDDLRAWVGTKTRAADERPAGPREEEPRAATPEKVVSEPIKSEPKPEAKVEVGAAANARQSINELLQRYVTALNSRDLAALAALYDPAAAHVTPERTVVGTEAIGEWYRDFLERILPNGAFNVGRPEGEGTSWTFAWTCNSTAGQVLNGSDTLGLKGGKIVYHAVAFTIS